MKFSAVIFDLDGTLLDTLQDLACCSNRILKRNGFPTHPIEAYRVFVGNGARVCVSRALPPNSRHPAIIDRCLQLFLEEYAHHWNVHTKPYPGIPELLDALSRLGIKMAVLSNKPHENTKQCVKEYLSAWKFESVFGQKESQPKKPDPLLALQISNHFAMPPERILFIGDTSVDMQTARNAGMFPVGVLWGFRSRDELLQHGAKRIVLSPEEIIPLITG